MHYKAFFFLLVLIQAGLLVFWIDFFRPRSYIKPYSCHDSPNATSPILNGTSGEGALCPCIPPNLTGRIPVSFEVFPYSVIYEKNKFVQKGGRWKPLHCRARHRVAIIIPYRDREQHLKIFLNHMHPFLKSQLLDYRIIVVEQVKGSVFNKAALMNSAFVEGLMRYKFNCFIFHDVDMLPEVDYNIYTCDDQPRHLGAMLDKFRYVLPYPELFGGAIALKKEHFIHMNGFSNMYIGWGGEDDDMYNRVIHQKYKIYRYPPEVSRYKMIRHTHDKGNPVNSNKNDGQINLGRRYDLDGLNSLTYKLLVLEERTLYTWLYMDVDKQKVGVSNTYPSLLITPSWLYN